MNERLAKCPACGADLDRTAKVITYFVCGSYTVGDSTPARSRDCLCRELATLRRFRELVLSADAMRAADVAIEIRRIVNEYSNGAVE